MQSISMEKGPVCVTGGTGFIASWLIMKLLDRGYSVHTTLRFDPAENKKDISYLTNLPNASKNLKIFNADLTKSESFTEAVKGCTGVFLLAHPSNPNGSLSTQTVTKIAVEGTLGILRACLDSKMVKRVIYTSSSVTVMPNDKSTGFVDESIWTNVSMFETANTKGTSYVVAKTKTERAVWEFAEKYGLDVVSLIPPIVFGPFICPWVPNTVQMGLALILGKTEYYGVLCKSNIVHVDDLASANIFVFESPEANGRYICSSNEITIQKLAEFFSAKYSQFQIPSSEVLDKVEGYKAPSLSSMRLVDLGFRFKYDLDEMFAEAIQCCIEKGYIT